MRATILLDRFMGGLEGPTPFYQFPDDCGPSDSLYFSFFTADLLFTALILPSEDLLDRP